jgi:dCTP deaminase
MVLSDKSIKERIRKKSLVIEPLDEGNVQPASVDLHLGNKFIIFSNHTYEVFDVKKNIENTTLVEIEDDGFFIIHPDEFVLATTVEFVAIPDDLLGRLDGRSSVGRTGLIIHASAGFIDPGYEGNITLHMFNFSKLPIKIYPHMRIAQMSFEEMTTPVEIPYGSKPGRNKYNGQRDPIPSQIWKDFIGK